LPRFGQEKRQLSISGDFVQVCGDGEGLVGDAVVPICSAMLEGAQQVALNGVFHSMSRVGTFNKPSGVLESIDDD
jgi:hypothetical protein